MAQSPIQQIGDVLRDALIHALEDRKDELTAIAVAGGKATHDPLSDVGDIAHILNLLLNVIAITQPEFALPVAVKDAADAAGGKAGRAVGSGYFLGYMMFQFAAPYLNYITHAIADAAQSEIFDPETSARLVARGIIPLNNGKSEAHGGGFDDPHFLSMVDDATTRPEVATLMMLRNLDQINDEDVRKALQRHGYSDFWLQPLQALRRYLLSPADLALANLRGNIDNATMSGYAKQLGVTDADMQVLVENTGEPPGPQQLMEALRRGFIDDTRFERGIRQSRVRNEWIDVEHKLTVQPMSVADAVRAVVEGHLDQNAAREIAFHNGLERDHFDILVESWGRPLSHEQMMTLLHRGRATVDEVRQAFRESDLKNKYIDQAIELGRHLVPERTVVSMVDHGVINHDTAVQMLLDQGFIREDADALIRLGAAQRTGAAKHLSRTDVVAMYADRILTRDEAIVRLRGLGYDARDAQAALELADFKLRASTLKATQRGIEASFKAHRLDAEKSRQELVKAGMPRDQAAELVDEWQLQRGVATRSLTEAQVVKLAQAKLISSEDALNRLVGLGLDRVDARLWLTFEGVIKGTP